MTDNEKEYIYANYLDIENYKICENLNIPEYKLSSFLSKHTVGEMMDKFAHLNKEGHNNEKMCNNERRLIQVKTLKPQVLAEKVNGIEMIVIQSKLNYM